MIERDTDTSGRNELLIRWFDRLVDLSTEARSQALADADMPDSLRAELRDLIEIDAASADSNLFAAIGKLNVANMLPTGFDYLSLLGKQLGQYRIVELLGHGGFGYVFSAVRSKDYQQRVAIKIMRHDRQANAAIVKRFEQERQLLAKLQHENISRILDGGETEAGYPYFVMEYVNGQPITTYCNQRRLTIGERLELFRNVCDAVGHAHQLGIVHRDLKPRNILVSSTGTVKLLDFGIAKVLQNETEGESTATESGVTPMTPCYASPEQLRGEACTLASDVYSLGVILYEMLTGAGPYSAQSGPLLTHRILSEDAVLPSRRYLSLSANRRHPPSRTNEESPSLDGSDSSETSLDPHEIARQRSSTRGSLYRALRGDLDRLVMMAIRKEPMRRYTSARDLGQDIDRYSSKLPVRACGDSLGYVVAKYCSRNRSSVVLAAVLFASLAFGLWAFDWQQSRLEIERARITKDKTAFDRTQYVTQQLVPLAIQLRNSRKNFDAYNLVKGLTDEFPNNQPISELFRSVSADASIDVGLSDTEILMRPATEPNRPWQHLGVTPYVGRIPLARLHLCFRTPGQEDVVVLGTVEQEPEYSFTLSTDATQYRQAPEGMVWIPPNAIADVSVDGTKYNLPQAFYLDRCEVTNKQFQEFIQKGGYEDRSLWPQFEAQGVELSFEDAIDRFRHPKTGRPAPSVWPDGEMPTAEEDFPVHGISWYEAFAYAKFRGKTLPTFYHWLAASGTYNAASIVPNSNLGRSKTTAVGVSHGIGPYGTEDMAGNVAEWCLNKTPDGLHFALGGMWSDPGYMFVEPAVRSPFDRSGGAGIRCMQAISEIPAMFSQDRPLDRRDFAKIGTSPEYGNERIFNELLRPFYDYDRNDLEFTVEPASTFYGYRSIRIAFNPAYRTDDLAAVYLLLPDETQFAKPFQPIICFPGAGVLVTDEIEGGPACYIDAGRAYICPVYWGTSSRKSDEYKSAQPRKEPIYDEATKRIALDLRRAIDVAEQQRDLLDMDKLAYYGYSWGAAYGPLMLAIESRIRVAILHCGGAFQTEANAISETSNYFPFVKVPTLMLNCKNDAIFPIPAQKAMYDNLRLTEPTMKRHLIYETDYGHFAPPEGVAGEGQAWLDERFGAPRKL